VIVVKIRHAIDARKTKFQKEGMWMDKFIKTEADKCITVQCVAHFLPGLHLSTLSSYSGLWLGQL